jgi:Glycosyl transferase family 2
VRHLRPLLAATLIVRDEAHQLADCLAALDGVVDEIVVYDTGSRDGTRGVARHAGARVLAGYWDDDFARARNEALGMTRAEWSLIVDADERLVVDGDVLRSLLRGGPAARSAGAGPQVGGLTLAVISRAGDGRVLAAHPSLRLVRTAGARWEGRAHEVLRPGGRGRRSLALPQHLAHLEHLGYVDARAVRAKAERNLALIQAELDHLVAAGSTDVVAAARVLYDLARSALELGYRQTAVDALETLRELVPGGRPRTLATALLAQVLLDAGGFEEVVLVLAAEVRADPDVDPRFADWLRARAVAGLGRPDEALALLRGIDRLVDPSGIEQPVEPVLRARAVLAERLGYLAEAQAAMSAALRVAAPSGRSLEG